ncbi:MAG: hypothetical protein WC854_10605 [Bacteroidales bacterium]
MKISVFANRIPDSRAKEYLECGVGRRTILIRRCIENVFSIFPVERLAKLSKNENIDVDINLHAFIINVHGIIENLGLSIAHGYRLFDKSRSENQQKHELGLFNSRFISRFKGRIRDYFCSDIVVSWYKQYSTNYRDSLAHRIPAYIPPAGLNDDEIIIYNQCIIRINEIYKTGWSPEVSMLLEKVDSLGVANPTYVHSEIEKAKTVALHPQMLCDYLTVEEMINVVIDNYDLTKASTL